MCVGSTALCLSFSPILLALILSVLKLEGVVALSWKAALAPLYAELALIVIAAIFAAIGSWCNTAGKDVVEMQRAERLPGRFGPDIPLVRLVPERIQRFINGM